MKVLKCLMFMGLASGYAYAQDASGDAEQSLTAKKAKKLVRPEKSSADIAARKQQEALDFTVDIEQKRKDIVALVKKGVDKLLGSSAEQAFYAFLNDRNFVLGDVSLFVFDTAGTVYVQGMDLSAIWADFKKYKNAHGIVVADLLMHKANKGGGWVDYEWHNGYKSSYVEKIKKGETTYIIGAGWYPGTKRNSVENIVKAAVAAFYKLGKEAAFHEFSNKVGAFVRGDLYIYAYDMNGYCLAHGDNTALIGRDLSGLKDDNGFLVVQGLIKAGVSGDGWLSYTWKNAPKIGYVQKVSDSSGTYIIGSGYYPEAGRNTVVSLVKRGVKYFNSWGREKAAAQFSYKVGDFVYGDLTVFMYDFKGTVLGQGDNPELVGQNLYDLRSPSGEYIVRDLIDTAEHGSGWITYEWKNALSVAYVEKVTDPKGDYLIGCGFYPDSPREKVIGLVRKAKGFLKANSMSSSMREFIRPQTPFSLDGHHLFVFNVEGDCLAYGDNYALLWKNFKKFKDSEGKQVMRYFMQSVQKGPGWVEYRSKNRNKMAYVEKIEKGGKSYIIGSAFYK